MRIRGAEDRDLEAVARLYLAADDSRVTSPEAMRHMRRTRPEHARTLELVAEIDGAVVAAGTCGVDVWTAAEGSSCWISSD